MNGEPIFSFLYERSGDIDQATLNKTTRGTGERYFQHTQDVILGTTDTSAPLPDLTKKRDNHSELGMHGNRVRPQTLHHNRVLGVFPAKSEGRNRKADTGLPECAGGCTPRIA